MIAGLDRRYGGPAQSVPRLCEALRQNGVETQLLSVRTGADADATVRNHEAGATLFPWDLETVPLLRSLRASSSLSRELMRQAEPSTIIHNHGLWLMPNVYAGRAAVMAGAPLVVSPRGMLAPGALRISKVRKALFWQALQKRAFAQASCFHATSETEYRDIRAFGIRAPVAIIPNGVDLPEVAKGQRSREKSVLFLGRLHPIKNLPHLLAAWQQLESQRPDWRLRLVGADEDGHAGVLRSLVKQFRLRRVTIEQPKYGPDRDALLASASLLILPSESENFGMVVAEGLAAGIPVMASRGTPWAGLERERCGWWVANDPQSLAATLEVATKLSAPKLAAMGERGRRWMERGFGWSSVANELVNVYRWVAGSPTVPSCVRLD